MASSEFKKMDAQEAIERGVGQLMLQVWGMNAHIRQLQQALADAQAEAQAEAQTDARADALAEAQADADDAAMPWGVR
jgi:hypothetical protein